MQNLKKKLLSIRLLNNRVQELEFKKTTENPSYGGVVTWCLNQWRKPLESHKSILLIREFKLCLQHTLQKK